MPDRRRDVLRTLATVGTALVAGCGFPAGSGGDGTTTAADPASRTAPATHTDSTTPRGTLPVSPTATGTRADTARPTATPDAGGTASTEASTRTPETTTVPPSLSGQEREIYRVGQSLRSSVARLRTTGRLPPGMAWFLRDDVLATHRRHLGNLQAVELASGGTASTTLLGRTRADADLPIGALRTTSPGQPLPVGDQSALSTGDVVVSVAFEAMAREWLVSYGRVRAWIGDRERFVTSMPLVYRGAPVVTLDGAVVGMPVDFRQRARGTPSTPPAPISPAVQTSRESWWRPVHAPVAAVVDRIEAWTA